MKHKIMGYAIRVRINYEDFYFGYQDDGDFFLQTNPASSLIFRTASEAMDVVTSPKFIPKGSEACDVLKRASKLTQLKTFKAQIAVIPLIKDTAIFKESLTVNI